MVDYLVAPRLDLPTTPFLCIVEAKKDDFEKGLAQCLVELHTCAQINAKKKKTQELFGIVTNAEGWKFYRRDPTGAFYETPLHALTHLQQLLGILDYVFARCEENLNATL